MTIHFITFWSIFIILRQIKQIASRFLPEIQKYLVSRLFLNPSDLTFRQYKQFKTTVNSQNQILYNT